MCPNDSHRHPNVSGERHLSEGDSCAAIGAVVHRTHKSGVDELTDAFARASLGSKP